MQIQYQVKLSSSTVVDNRVYSAGCFVTMDESVARDLIRRGKAYADSLQVIYPDSVEEKRMRRDAELARKEVVLSQKEVELAELEAVIVRQEEKLIAKEAELEVIQTQLAQMSITFNQVQIELAERIIECNSLKTKLKEKGIECHQQLKTQEEELAHCQQDAPLIEKATEPTPTESTSTESAPTESALVIREEPTEKSEESSLSRKSKAQLLLLAQERKLEVSDSMTKAQLIEVLEAKAQASGGWSLPSIW